MLPIMPGDKLIIGGGLTYNVLKLELTADHQVVVLARTGQHYGSKEQVCYHQLLHHLCNGFVERIRES